MSNQITVGELVALLQAMPPNTPVIAEAIGYAVQVSGAVLDPPVEDDGATARITRTQADSVPT